LLTHFSCKCCHAADNNLVGELPSELFNIPIRIQLILHGNKGLTGTLPQSVGNSKLIFLELQNCNLHGTIPMEIGSNNKLDTLDLSNNTFSGTLPNELGKKMRILKLHSNNFTGNVPENYGKLKKLKKFEIFGNPLIETIPNTLCTDTQIRRIEIDCDESENSTQVCICCVCRK